MGGSQQRLSKDSVAPVNVIAQEEGRERSREAPTYFLPDSETQGGGYGDGRTATVETEAAAAS